jgi:acyl dehydratase
MIDYHALKARRFPELAASYSARDTMLYALGVGYGADPTDERQLDFVYEKNLRAAPTMAVVLAYPGFWVKEPDTGIDWVRVLHGEQSLELHRPLAPQGKVTGRTRVKALVDKGKDRGALLVHERRLYGESGELLATVESLSFCRGDGGFSERPGNGPRGGDPAPPTPPATPDTPPEIVCDLPTAPQAALVYRLSGDFNPLHAEPAVARAAGFARPILHGLATYGVAGHAILKSCCGYDPARLRSLAVRFSAPVYPGETIRTEIWRKGSELLFRARALERDIVVLSHGRAGLA